MKGLTGYYGPSLASEGQRPDSLEDLFLWGYKGATPLREVTKTAGYSSPLTRRGIMAVFVSSGEGFLYEAVSNLERGQPCSKELN